MTGAARTATGGLLAQLASLWPLVWRLGGGAPLPEAVWRLAAAAGLAGLAVAAGAAGLAALRDWRS